MIHTISQLFVSLRQEKQMFQNHSACVKHRAVLFWMTFRTLFYVFLCLTQSPFLSLTTKSAE